ncbi:hypothetical protein [Tessaracoccus sp.]
MTPMARRTRVPRPWPEKVPVLAQERFAGIGWTYEDWARCRREQPSRHARHWLLHPPVFTWSITPEQFLETTGRYGWRSISVLNGLTEGAPPRLATALLCVDAHANVPACWATAQQLGWAETEAVGWALAGMLRSNHTDTETFDRTRLAATTIRRTHQWIQMFGPEAYLWVLAGYDLHEAQQATRLGPVTLEQLRVMVVLNGAELP